MNRYDLTDCLSDFLDVQRLDTPPTRDGANLDEIYSNLNDHVKKCQVKPPLQSDEGTTSDHLTLIAEMSIPCRHVFDWITYYPRDMKREDRLGFLRAYGKINWEDLLGNVSCPDQMVEMLHSKMNELNDRFFPMRKRKIRSTDDPWITEEIKRVIRKRKRRFDKHHRGPQWKVVKAETVRLMKESKSKYKEALDKMQHSNAGQLLPWTASSVTATGRGETSRIFNFSPRTSCFN